MAVLNIYDLTGNQTGTVEVKDSIFGIEPNQAVLHEVLTAELAAARQGTAATKTRAMVRGGGRKPFKQKVHVCIDFCCQSSDEFLGKKDHLTSQKCCLLLCKL